MTEFLSQNVLRYIEEGKKSKGEIILRCCYKGRGIKFGQLLEDTKIIKNKNHINKGKGQNKERV